MLKSIIYYSVKFSAALMRILPVNMALWFGHRLGDIVYVIDVKHKALTYANLNKAFATEKSPQEIRKISKQVFRNIGQNIIELCRLPLIDKEQYEKYIEFEGRSNIDDALKKGNGCILLATHFGSWEIANLSCAMYGYPYKVLVRKQPKYSRLDELLNSYRSCNGSVVIPRGSGTRDLVKSLKNNEVIGMVFDQGGREGSLVPFFGRNASMSVGAIRLALKFDVPICFSVITRENGPYHKIVVEKPVELVKTGNVEKDIQDNLIKLMQTMEHYTRQTPSEYVWMYKIWKYSNQSNILILHDGKMGHLRQSQKTAQLLQKTLDDERDIESHVDELKIQYRSPFKYKVFSLFYVVFGRFLRYGRLAPLKNFLTPESYNQLCKIKPDFIISCGSSAACINHLMSKDHQATSIAILKPGPLSMKKFDLVLLPQHDVKPNSTIPDNVTVIRGAPNLISKKYLEQQTKLLCTRYSHLKTKVRYKIGILIGGDSKDVFISEDQIKILIQQVTEAAKAINADIIISTSRRTPTAIDQYLHRTLKKDPRCLLLIQPNQEDVPEAVGGILGLSDLIIVSGDSISMVSEAASSGKKTIVFMPKTRDAAEKKSQKHRKFVERLNDQGFILSSRTKNMSQAIYDIAKQKIHTRPLDESKTIAKALKEVI